MDTFPADSFLDTPDFSEKYPKIGLLPKPTDGYLYIVQDSVYPELFKFGFSQDIHTRLRSYNENRPINSCTFYVISDLLKDAKKIEQLILKHMYQTINPIGMKKEWFEIKHLDMVVDYIKQAEEHEF